MVPHKYACSDHMASQMFVCKTGTDLGASLSREGEIENAEPPQLVEEVTALKPSSWGERLTLMMVITVMTAMTAMLTERQSLKSIDDGLDLEDTAFGDRYSQQSAGSTVGRHHLAMDGSVVNRSGFLDLQQGASKDGSGIRLTAKSHILLYDLHRCKNECASGKTQCLARDRETGLGVG